MKLLIIGHARHGKDTVAEILERECGLRFTSSSYHVAGRLFEVRQEWGLPDYSTVDECYADRSNWRDVWHQFITDYNTPDASRMCREILEKSDVYVGMRARREVDSVRSLFDLIVWVDAGDRLPPEPYTSNNLDAEDADIVIPNHGTLEELRRRVRRFARVARLAKRGYAFRGVSS